MSCDGMVELWLQENKVSRFEGYTGTPKSDRRITIGNGTKRQKVLTSERDVRRINKFGKYIERNF